MTLFSALQNIYSGCCTHCALDISAVGIYDPLPTASIEESLAKGCGSLRSPLGIAEQSHELWHHDDRPRRGPRHGQEGRPVGTTES